MSLTIVGNAVALAPTGGVLANVANVATKTNTFHITNASTTVYAYVGVYPTYAQAIVMDHPSVGTDGGGTIIPPNGSLTITGNFGPSLLATQANVFVAAITASGSTTVFVTPVAQGSSAN